jgi:hypothetical protein
MADGSERHPVRGGEDTPRAFFVSRPATGQQRITDIKRREREMREKTIITAAITGSIHTPTMSPYLPITPQQIADEAVAASEAGAAVVHVHGRNP